MATVTGTSGPDILDGTIIADILYGYGGDDILRGHEGNDKLIGGTGADTMIGGIGDDKYYVDNINDVVTENAGEGTDVIVSTISYSLGADLENLRLTGVAAINGTGNALGNVMRGNGAANVLDGGAGNDTILGYAETTRSWAGPATTNLLAGWVPTPCSEEQETTSIISTTPTTR